jgi:SAM-dependent methyltransferase
MTEPPAKQTVLERVRAYVRAHPRLKQRLGFVRRLWQTWNHWFHPLRTANAYLRHHMRQNTGYVRGRLLDVGCGQKPYADLFQVACYIGIELPPGGQGVVDAYASGLALPFAAGAFDTVLSNEVLEHVPEPAQLLAEVSRVLRPGGHLVLTTPQTWGLHLVPHDYYRYTPFGLRYLAKKSGLEVVRVYPTTGFWVTFTQRFCDVLFYTNSQPNFPWWAEQVLRVPCALIQLLGVGLDKVFGQRGDTLDNVLVARRPGP